MFDSIAVAECKKKARDDIASPAQQFSQFLSVEVKTGAKCSRECFR